MAKAMSENDLKSMILTLLKAADEGGLLSGLTREEAVGACVDALGIILRQRGWVDAPKAKAATPHEIGSW